MIWQARIGSSGSYTDMPTPSSYRIDWEDLDKNSYRSSITGDLYRHPLSKHWMKIAFNYNYITATDLNTITSMVNQNNLYIKAKTPAFGTNGWIEMQGYVSKFSAELLEGQIGYSLSFNFVQSKKVSGQ